MDQIQRRVFEGEEIPQEDKVFSVFEPHTEWIVKGKAGVSQELGLKVSIAEDQHQFILHHEVMEKTEDLEIAASLVLDTCSKFENVSVVSFDKGYYSPENKEFLQDILERVVMPKKGSPAPEESEEEFRLIRKKHAAVESAINGLEHHGLDRVLDHGLDGFKRYVSLSILSSNLHQLGRLMKKCNKISDLSFFTNGELKIRDAA